MKQNIIFLTIDGVVFKSLFDSDNKISSAPFINSLSKKSIVFENFFSNGGTTQFSLPSIFTSTYPLDCGGYDDGIKDRPTSFIETLKQNQYKTLAIYNGFFGSSLYYYNRGFDEFIDLFPPRKLTHYLYNDFINFYKKENLNLNDNYVFNRIESKIKKTLKWYRNTVHNTEHKIAFHDYKYLERKVNDEITELEIKKNHYVNSVFQNSTYDNRFTFFLTNSVFKFKLIQKMIKHIFVISIFFFNKIFILKSLNIDFKNNFHFFNKRNFRNLFIFSGNQIIKKAIQWIEKNTKNDQDKPFFLWMHLNDHHDLNYNDSEYKINSTSFSNYKKISDFYCLLKQQQQLSQKDIKLHMSLFYCDLQINNFFNYLEKKNIFENTLLILTSDHGNRKWSRYDYRTKDDKNADNFFDEFCHIPLLFYSKNIKARNSKQLSSCIDLAPTILDYLSIKKNTNFIGKSLFAKNFNNNLIICENLGKGPCDFKFKKIKVSIRSYVAKINFVLIPNADPHKCKIESCYDLIKDADELRNLKDDKNFMRKHYNLKKIAINRFKCIRNQIDF